MGVIEFFYNVFGDNLYWLVVVIDWVCLNYEWFKNYLLIIFWLFGNELYVGEDIVVM